MSLLKKVIGGSINSKVWIMRLLLLIFSLYLFATDLLACQPCPRVMSFKEVYQAAGLVVVVQRKGETPVPSATGEDNQTKFKVLNVLKGDQSLKDQVLGARAWHGMCSYGLFLDNDTDNFLIFLGSDGKHYFNYSCGPGNLKVIDGKVQLKNESVKLSEAIKRWQ